MQALRPHISREIAYAYTMLALSYSIALIERRMPEEAFGYADIFMSHSQYHVTTRPNVPGFCIAAARGLYRLTA